MTGFFARGMGWIGQQPNTATPDGSVGAELMRGALATIDGKSITERTQAVKRELLAHVPGELARAVRETTAEVARLEGRVRETGAALATLTVHEPAEHELDGWLAEKARLEGALPHLKRLHGQALVAQNAAIEAARLSIADVCRDRGEAAQAAHNAMLERQRMELEAATLMFRIEREGAARARMFGAADLAE